LHAPTSTTFAVPTSLERFYETKKRKQERPSSLQKLNQKKWNPKYIRRRRRPLARFSLLLRRRR